jgi:predicted methyltransferase
MNIVKTIEQYDENNIYFCEPIKNNVMNDGFFIRILYSTSLFVINGINLFISLNEVNIDKYYNKYRCSFNTVNHKNMIENVKIIEENLLKNVNIKNKIPQFKIYEQLKNGNIKIFSENIEKINNNLFMLKISGIWETEFHYGVTYKFVKINHQ